MRTHRREEFRQGLQQGAPRDTRQEYAAWRYSVAQGQGSGRQPDQAAQSSTTLPLCPDSMASNPCWNSLARKRCVMMGDISSPLCSMATILYQVSNISRP